MTEVEERFKKLGSMFKEEESDFLKLIPTKFDDPNEIRRIYKALMTATKMHKDNKPRKSGKPYITHPRAVASILAEFGFDSESVIAALLHDLIEDTDYTLKECERDFGTDVATMVDGVTKIGSDVNKPTHEKIISASSKNIKSLAIKGADRLHNMYTLEYMSPKKQVEIATETDYFYIPITKILAIYQLRDEFQDLCMFYLHNPEFKYYDSIRNNLKQHYIPICEELADETQVRLTRMGIAMTYDCRIKNVGGIYSEVQKGKNIRDIDDLVAIKMRLKQEGDCYHTLDVVDGISLIDNESKKDYIENPKTNGYRSLNVNTHYEKSNIQVRVRTEKMQRINDLGVFSDLNDDVQKRVSENMRKSLNDLVKKGE